MHKLRPKMVVEMLKENGILKVKLSTPPIPPRPPLPALESRS
ncbi:hypothetical protein TIFTF001_021336 [Ficus carica]|uniref:Uncharacterized protein n=1 Tax=Ficus carica TaxID=3494 RepID=A0AA88DJS5_FICCA|nr:hypothetical protein TIFTF001_021336 [Ficus carica]